MSDNTTPGPKPDINDAYERLLLAHHILAGIGTIDACKRKVEEFLEAINYLADTFDLVDIKHQLDNVFAGKISELDGKDGVKIEDYHALLKELQVLLGEAKTHPDVKYEIKAEGEDKK